MSAAKALRAARMAGIDVRIEDGGLALEAEAPPSAEILELLARHKPGIIALLRPGRDGWSAEDWQSHFDERAGIAEFDGGLPGPETGARVFEYRAVEWLNRNLRTLAAGTLSRLRWRPCPRRAAAVRHRTDRPCLAVFPLLACLARRAQGRCRCRPHGDGHHAIGRIAS